VARPSEQTAQLDTDLHDVLADTVVEWLAENDYIDPARRDADWNKWRDELSALLGSVVVDPYGDRAA